MEKCNVGFNMVLHGFTLWTTLGDFEQRWTTILHLSVMVDQTLWGMVISMGIQDLRLQGLHHIRPYISCIFPYVGLKNRLCIWQLPPFKRILTFPLISTFQSLGNFQWNISVFHGWTPSIAAKRRRRLRCTGAGQRRRHEIQPPTMGLGFVELYLFVTW